MTAIKHHINDQLLMGYAAGALPRAFDLVVATHVSLNDDARARLAGFEAIGGSVLESAGSADLADDSLEATLARIAGGPASAPARPAPRRADAVFPAPLYDMVGGDAEAVTWRPVGMGVKQAILHADDEASVRLLYIPAGQAVPAHTHKGTELTLVLQGAYRDEDDVFARGDIEIADEELHHTPLAIGEQDCICLAATDAPLKFQGLLPRIAQPFLRI